MTSCTRSKGCTCRQCYPYRHNGPTVYGSQLADYFVSMAHARQDNPEKFTDDDELEPCHE